MYATGYFEGYVRFGNITLTSAGEHDVYLVKYDAAGNVLWAQQAGGTGEDQAYGISVDATGNVYVTGSFETTATFGGTALTSVGYTDIFIAKYNAAGNILWAKRAGGGSPENAYGVAVDGQGNAFITGRVAGTASFGSVTLPNAGSGDVFIAKYDAAGTTLWAVKAGGNYIDNSYGISTDGAGNVYIIGDFQGIAYFGASKLTSAGSQDIFLAKYDAAGNPQWAQSAGGSGADIGYGIAADKNGNAYITGFFSGTATFGDISVTTAGSIDMFLTKYDQDGKALWAQRAGGTGSDVGYGIALDGTGNPYVTGDFASSARFGRITLQGNSYQSFFMAKYDTTGAVRFAKGALWGTTKSYGIAVDAAGKAVVTGNTQGSITFGDYDLTAKGSSDVYIARYSEAGNVLWAEMPFGFTATDYGRSVAVDNAGNAVVAGYFLGSITLGSTTLVSTGINNAFLAKYDAAGNVRWAQRAGGSSVIYPTDMAIDGAGNIHVTGYFLGNATFGTTTLISPGNYDIFLAKYDAAGNVLWAKRAGGLNNIESNGIALDASGNIYVTGEFSVNATFENSTLTSTGTTNAFLAKYDAAGNVLWAQKVSGGYNDYGYDLAVDGAGDVYVTGSFAGTSSFGTTSLVSSSADVFLVKYSAAGNVLWAQKAGGSSLDYSNSIALDATGNIYVTGDFSGTAAFGSTSISSTGNKDVFIAKFDGQGNALWAQKAGGTGIDVGYRIAIDNAGNAFITGSFQNAAAFGSTRLASAGGTDAFMVAYDPAGTALWAQRAGGALDDYSNSISLDNSENVFITGYFQGSATFGTSNLTTHGRTMFLAKLAASTVTGIEALEEEDGLVVYPNPATEGLVEVRLSGVNSGNISVSLYNSLGQLAQKQVVAQGGGQLNVEALAAGIYVLRAEYNGKTYVKRLVIQ